MDSRKRIIVRVVVFICIFAVLFEGMMKLFSQHPDFRIYQIIGGFYQEPEDSLQAVYIGSSNCYAFWNPLVAWQAHGLAIYPYSTPSLPFYATEYVMREARKTQPHARFIVNLNSVEADDMDAQAIYSVLSYMPDSENKWALMNYLADLLGYNKTERLQFHFPWIRVREYWLKLLKQGLFPKLNGLKGACVYDSYLNSHTDLSKRYGLTELRSPVSDALVEATQNMLDYCDAENLEVLFVSVPRGEKSETSLGRINTVVDLIRDRGYEVLYLTDKADEVGMDLTQDYYNARHTNVHGSIKFTDYICNYMIEHFGLEDLRGDVAYASWDASWAKYYDQYLAPYVLDIELDGSLRDIDLPAPEGLAAVREGGDTALRWDASDGAVGYAVYRKQGDNGAWQRIAETESPEYRDADSDPNCFYTVVPMRNSGRETLYGRFSYSGVRPADAPGGEL